LGPIVGQAFSYNDNDQIAGESYDANGNTLTSGGNTYTYDSQNRLKSANGSTVTMQYDGDGNRIAKTVTGLTTQYLIDDLNPTGYPQVVEEIAGGVVQRGYTYGHQRISQRQLVNSAFVTSY